MQTLMHFGYSSNTTYRTPWGTDGLVTFDTAYNQNEPAWEQLIEVYYQRKVTILVPFGA